MPKDKYRQSDEIEQILSLHKSKGWELYQEDLKRRIIKLNGIKDSLLSQHKDREAGEALAKSQELMISIRWVENKKIELQNKEKK